MHEASSTDPQEVRSRAHGRGFIIPLVSAWPLGIVVGVVAIVLGAGVAIGLASGLAAALGLNFVWLGITFAVDDGMVDARARGAVKEDGVATADPVLGDRVDEASRQSFPASDPPSWRGGG